MGVGAGRRVGASSALRASRKADRFVESVIREMTRVADAHGAINLAQGFPDFPCPSELKSSAAAAIEADINQYAVTWGAPRLRAAIEWYMRNRRGLPIEADRQVTVCCGATEGMVAAMMGILDPGDEVIIPEPYYENYGPDCVLSGAVPRYVPLAPGFALDVDALAAQVTEKTRAVVLNTPHNPTGRVFSNDEIGALCKMCVENDLLLFTDEIYEEILFTGVHRSPASWPGMAERTVIVSGASKTYSVTGWRIGWIITPPALTDGVRKVHDFLTVGAPAPLQEAIADALCWDDEYYDAMRAEYLERRDVMVAGLRAAGFPCETPEGAYYSMVDIGAFLHEGESDVEFAMRLVRDAGVATVPGSSFYADPADGARQVRFCYAKRLETLNEAVARLKRWAQA